MNERRIKEEGSDRLVALARGGRIAAGFSDDNAFIFEVVGGERLKKLTVKTILRFPPLIDLKFCAVTSRNQFSQSGETAARHKGKTTPVDQQTKQALKHDQFVDTTNHGLEWASENRRSVIVTSAVVLAAILIVVVGVLVYNSRASQASVAFGAAMQAYQTPLAAPGQPVPPGVKTYPSVAERAKAANDLFMGVADKYGMTPDGRVARYFGGLTYMEQGQNASAESTLKQVAGGWNGDLAALANLSLAQLYRQTGRDPQAIELYNQLTAKPTSTVPSGLAQLQLAELYETEGKPDLAKKIYAQLKDKDAKGPAGALAAQKLNPAPAGPAGQ